MPDTSLEEGSGEELPPIPLTTEKRQFCSSRRISMCIFVAAYDACENEQSCAEDENCVNEGNTFTCQKKPQLDVQFGKEPPPTEGQLNIELNVIQLAIFTLSAYQGSGNLLIQCILCLFSS